MKRLLIALIPFLFINCSSSDDGVKDSTDTNFKLPSWLADGEYIADEGIIAQFPYPSNHPYSIKIQNGDFVIKATKTSATETLKERINKAGDKLKSVVESETNPNTYKITVTVKQDAGSTDYVFSFLFAKTSISNKIHVSYNTSNSGSSSLYTKK